MEAFSLFCTLKRFTWHLDVTLLPFLIYCTPCMFATNEYSNDLVHKSSLLSTNSVLKRSSILSDATGISKRSHWRGRRDILVSRIVSVCKSIPHRDFLSSTRDERTLCTIVCMCVQSNNPGRASGILAKSIEGTISVNEEGLGGLDFLFFSPSTRCSNLTIWLSPRTNPFQ